MWTTTTPLEEELTHWYSTAQRYKHCKGDVTPARVLDAEPVLAALAARAQKDPLTSCVGPTPNCRAAVRAKFQGTVMAAVIKGRRSRIPVFSMYYVVKIASAEGFM